MSWKIVILVAAAMTLAGAAIAGNRASSENVTFCAAKKGGDLSLGSKGKCAKGEKKLTIAKQGPQGEQGAPGKDGAPEDLAPEPVLLVETATGPENDDCVNTPGRFCGNASGHCGTWQNRGGGGDLPAGYRKDSGGWVHLQGSARLDFQGACGGVPAPPGMFYLPTGYRPAANARFSAPHCLAGNDDAAVTIGADGLIAVDGGSGCVSLDGIEFHP